MRVRSRCAPHAYLMTSSQHDVETENRAVNRSHHRRPIGLPLHPGECVKKPRILLANSNQWHFNNLVKKPCHETHCRCPHRLHLSFQSSRSCALPSIKVLKDKDLEFANSIWAFCETG